MDDEVAIKVEHVSKIACRLPIQTVLISRYRPANLEKYCKSLKRTMLYGIF